MNLKSKAKLLLGIILLTPALGLGNIYPEVCAATSFFRPRPKSFDRSSLDMRLLEAMHHQNPQEVNYCLRAGANLSTFDIDDRFFGLVVAVHNGFYDAVRTILNAERVSPLVYINRPSDDIGTTLLHVATICVHDPVNRLNIVKTLLEHGADPNIENSSGHTPIYYCQYENDMLDVAKALIEYGARESVLNLRLAAATAKDDQSDIEISEVRDLLSQGAELESLSDACLTNILCCAAENDDSNLIHSVLHVNPSIVNGVDSGYGLTALMYAVDENRLDAVRTLLDNGADPNEFGDQCGNALFCAFGLDDDTILNELLRRGANINAFDTVWGTILHFETLEQATEGTLRKILEHGADVNVRDPDGNTPLLLLVKGACNHAYTSEKFKNLAVLLLRKGANPTISNNEGQTPIQYTQQFGNEAIVNALNEAVEEARK